MCGVPDSLGNLPIVDGSNATGQSDVTTDGAAAGAGIISTWPNGSHYGAWQYGSAGPSYVSITGLHLRNADVNYSYYAPGSNTLTQYGDFVACVNLASGTYIDVSGNDMDTCGIGFFTAENSNNAWATVTQLVTIMGNHIHKAGEPGQQSEHGAYFQSWYGLMQGNLVDEYLPTAEGSEIKWRGVEGIFRYNNLASGALRDFDLVDNQDGLPYVSFEGYLGDSGGSFYSSVGDTAGANIIAAYQESFQKDFIYGNEIFGASASQQIHYLGDQVSGMHDRSGTLYFYSNTLDDAQSIFDTGSNGDGFDAYYVPRIDARNNIFWAYHIPYPGASITMAFGSESTLILNAATNLMQAGTFTIQTPIMGANLSAGTSEGWSNGCDSFCQWPLSVPLNTHLYGLSDANYLTTSTEPYNSLTMVPPAGSAAIDAGTPLSGVLATMPVRWQYSIATNSLIPRLDPLTIGAVDYAAMAATPTFSPAAGQYNLAQSVTITSTIPLAKLHYTTNGSTPTANSTLYTGPITVSATETLQAIAMATGYQQSMVASAAYVIGPLAAMPSFSPAGESYTAAQMVTLSTTTTTGSPVIYYTLDGSNPATSATAIKYTAPFNVSQPEAINAITEASGYSNSAVASATYAINLPPASAPTFSVAPGTYSSVQTVAITTTTPNPAIFFTIDGTNPATSATANPYTGPITVSATQTINAITEAAGFANSAMASATYTINLPFAGPVYAQQCNNFTQYGETVSCTLAGVGAGHTLVIGVANMGTGMTGTVTSSSGTPILAVTDGNSIQGWILANTSAGSNTVTYTVTSNTRLWLSVVEYSNTADSPLDGTAFADDSSSWQGSGFLNTPNFTTASATDVLWSFCSGVNGTPTVGTAPVAWVGRPGPTGSSLLVEDGNSSAAGFYYGQCAWNEGEIITLALKAPAVLSSAAGPTFTPAAGTYTSAQTVTLSDTTPNAKIYYTTNGTTPTTSSALYTESITVSATETVKAIAIATGTSQSPVASAAYTIKAPTVILTTTTSISGSATAGYTVTMTIANSGTIAATNATLTSATLGAATGSTLPLLVGTIAAGSQVSLKVDFPGSAGKDGAAVAEKLSGTYKGGSFSADVRAVKLP
jgi:hypothetical protein